MHAILRRLLLLAPLALALLMPACVEQRRETPDYFDSAPRGKLRPHRLREQESKRESSNPLKSLGEGVGKLFAGGDAKKQPAMKITAPGGTVQDVPANFTGQIFCQSADGKTYRLSFRDGILRAIEPAGSPPSVEAAKAAAKDGVEK